MTRVALDSNILIYAELEPETEKGKRATELILRAARDGVIPVQVLGEYLRFVQRRALHAFAGAIRQSELFRAAFVTPPTTEAVLEAAAAFSSAHSLQFWDAVACAASISAGAKALLSEDMRDGRVLEGLRIINPFTPANLGLIDSLVAI